MQVNFTLPESWKEFLDSEVAAGGHGNVADYIQALLREARLRKAHTCVEALLEEGLNSGEATEWTADDWEDIWHEIEERQARRNGNPQ